MFAKFAGADFIAHFADQLFHFQFDWQAMTIPARHIGRIFAAHGLGFNDHVFQNFVNRMTDMNIAVGIGWAVVQHKAVTTGARLTDFLVQAHLFPARQHGRLTLRQIATHRKFGIGQVQRRFVLAFHFIVHS